MRFPRALTTSRAATTSTAILVLLALLVLSVLGGLPTPHGGNSHLRTAFSASFTIESNGSLSANGVFSRGGPDLDTYTLVANYSGSVLDLRTESILAGAGKTIDHTNGTAGLLVLQANSVTISGLNITGIGEALELYDVSDVSVSDNNFTVAGLALYVADSTSVTVSHNFGNWTQGALLDGSSNLWIDSNEFSGSTSDGLEASGVTALTLESNDFSHAAVEGLNLDSVTSTTVWDNRVVGETAGAGIGLSYVSDGNFSSNNITLSPYPVQISRSADVTLWNNSMSPGESMPYSVSLSDGIAILDTTALDPGTAGVTLVFDHGVTIAGADFAGSGYGVHAVASTSVQVLNSNLSSGQAGISSSGVSGLTVSGSDLAMGNEGLLDDGSSGILVRDSNLNRTNYPIDLIDTRNVTVEDSELDGAQVEGVYLNDTTDVTIAGCSILDDAGAGSYIIGSQGVTIESTDLDGLPLHPQPLGIATVDDTGVTLANDSLEWTTAPYQDSGSTGVDVQNSDVSNSTGDGIYLYGTENVQISGTDFFNDSGAGVDAQSVTNLSVSSSNFGETMDSGIAVSYSTEVSISDNEMNDEGENGIFLANVDNVLASGNSLNEDAYAVFLEVGTNIAIIGNTALNDSDGGIAAASDQNFALAGNNISEDSADDLTTLSLTDIQGLSVIGNTFYQDYEALQLVGNSSGTIVGNEFQDDNLSFDIDGPVVALAYHNDFRSDGGWMISNGPTLAWDDGYPVGGNFWSNYTGVDNFGGPGQNIPGADGIGDTPMILDANDTDHYPLMTPWASHDATFLETGLPSGTPWTVVFNGTVYSSTSNSVTIVSTVGTLTAFSYSIPAVLNYVSSPSSGQGMLGAGTIAVDITFTIPTFPLTFIESGLASGTGWGVTVGGVVHTSTTDALSLTLPNDTYNFSVDPVAGYVVSPGVGDVTLDGSSRTVALGFSVFTYNVTVIEDGLASGTSWSLSVGGNVSVASGPSLAVHLANGSYPFIVAPVNGYTSHPASGTWTVSADDLTVYVDFVQNATTVPPGSPSKTNTSSAPTANLIPYVIAIVVLAIVAAVGWILAARGRRGSGPSGGYAATDPSPAPEPSSGAPPPGAQ
jgi:nitrous oxidase accessory protein NosD